MQDELRLTICKKWNLVAMLGVMKAGGAFVPLDPTHPPSRLQRLIDSVKAEVVLCSQGRADALRPIAKTLIPICSDTLDQLPAPVDGIDLASGVTGQNAAYVLFTSGSTGEPKVSRPNVDKFIGLDDAEADDSRDRAPSWNTGLSYQAPWLTALVFAFFARLAPCNSLHTRLMPVWQSRLLL
jgi:non-ribosomal peptide synthetase component F